MLAGRRRRSNTAGIAYKGGIPAPYQADGMACSALGILVLSSSFGRAASSARLALNLGAVMTHATDWSSRMQTGGQ